MQKAGNGEQPVNSIRLRKAVLSLLVIALPFAVQAADNSQDPVYQQKIQRATQAVLWGMPAVSMMGLRRSSARALGATFNDIIYMSHPMVSRHGFLTANNQVPYVLSMLNTSDGPVVLEVPPASENTVFFGSAVDAWQVPIADVGPSGADKGKGGKYLFLPPGYDRRIPKGYLVFRPKTYHVYIGLRPVAVNGGTLEEGVAYSKRLKAYPLANPGKLGRYIDAFPKTWNTIPSYDISFFHDLAAMINEEPVQAKDLAMMGMLSSIGIQKGGEFKPDSRTAAALEQAAKLGYAQMQHYFSTPGRALDPFWPDHQWQALHLDKQQAEMGFPFTTENELLIDARSGGVYFWATWLPKHLGKDTFYLMGLRDSRGALLDGKSSYRLRVPKAVPARNFWSVIVYSMKTKGFIADSQKVGISSYEKAHLKANDDGSIDIYFAPEAPTGMESNWLPTGEPFFLIFRFYGPEKALFEKSWTLPDVEKHQ